MPFIPINGASIYYETFGNDRPGKAPVVLIHGSTGTGRSNWELIAPLLAQHYRVIVPDCRGHGQSSNPNMTYSFKEMAEDTAALIRALGYERAHVIGHSNGGNVALVTLLQHPQVCQTAIPQAANAWVSPDLPEKEPAIFDPDRVQRESPDWMNEMIALHGASHGPDYWRALLKMTVDELTHEPNYTPADLHQVQRPTLVIQGEVDRVNAPYRHAQFIAEHIPDAELWIPKGISHNVHLESTYEWVEKVHDFLQRRGDDANDALYRLRKHRFAGKETIFHVHAEMGESGRGGVNLTGQVLTAEQRQAARELFNEKVDAEDIRVLINDSTPWVMVKRGVTDLRRGLGRFTERVSQALLGESARILGECEEWSKIRLERDGYLGWMKTDALIPSSQEDAAAYWMGCTHIVQAPIAPAFVSPIFEGDSTGFEAGQLPFGVLVQVGATKDQLCEAVLPDGCRWWLWEKDLLPLTKRPQPDSAGIAYTLALFRRFIGVPYLWGGRTPYGFDCSGMAQAFLNFMGVFIPRDADQQFEAGVKVDGDPQPGDLLYFQEANDPDSQRVVVDKKEQSITHTAISLGNGECIHSTGAVDGVTINSLDPASPMYRPWLREHFAGARRF